MKPLMTLFTAALCAIFLSPAMPAEAAPLEATLPDFTIQINDTMIDNSHRSYPFLCYKGITYLPLTYFDCQALGTRAEYDDAKGLRLTSADIACAVPKATEKNANPSRAMGSTVDFPVLINGTPYHDERWPLIHYRNITYLPLTWNIAHNILGWDYSYNDATRTLAISGKTPKVARLDIPPSATIAAGDAKNNYYVIREGDALEATLNLWQQKDNERAVKIGSAKGYNESLHLLAEPYFSAYLGSPMMGNESLYRLSDGTMTKVPLSGQRVNLFDTPYGKVNADYGMMGRLEIEEDTSEFGWQDLAPHLRVGAVAKDDGSAFGANMMGLGLDGDWFYFYATDQSLLSRPYRVNLSDRRIEAIGDRFIPSTYRIYGDMLYYEEDGSLYRATLGESKDGIRQIAAQEKIIDTIRQWNIDGSGAIFYNTTNPADGWHLRTADGKDEKIAEGEKTNDQAIYAKNGVLCAQSDDGMIIIQGGKLLCKADCLVTAKARPNISADGFLVYHDGRGDWQKLSFR